VLCSTRWRTLAAHNSPATPRRCGPGYAVAHTRSVAISTTGLICWKRSSTRRCSMSGGADVQMPPKPTTPGRQPSPGDVKQVGGRVPRTGPAQVQRQRGHRALAQRASSSGRRVTIGCARRIDQYVWRRNKVGVYENTWRVVELRPGESPARWHAFLGQHRVRRCGRLQVKVVPDATKPQVGDGPVAQRPVISSRLGYPAANGIARIWGDGRQRARPWPKNSAQVSGRLSPRPGTLIARPAGQISCD
jgi:hypothetical protein